MSIALRIRRGEGPFWGAAKSTAGAILRFHVPVAGPTRPLFGLLYRVHVGVRGMLLWARRFFWCDPLFRSQCESVGRAFYMEQLPFMTGRGRIVIGDGVRLSGKPDIGFSNVVRDDPELVIGDGTFIGHGCNFSIADSIRIGRHCLLAAGVRIYDLDGHPIDASSRRAGNPASRDAVRPVLIGDDVWIGREAFVLKGVTVGDRAVIGARAVVTADVPPDTIVAGNPARFLKRLSEEPTTSSSAAPAA